jgi:hypothetical protein
MIVRASVHDGCEFHPVGSTDLGYYQRRCHEMQGILAKTALYNNGFNRDVPISVLAWELYPGSPFAKTSLFKGGNQRLLA